MAEEPASEVPSRRPGVVGALVVLALAVLPLLLAWAYGATDLVRNDDWAWSEILFRWADTGDLHLNGWPTMFLLGQLALAWPVARLFPDSVLALQLLGVVLGVVGALAMYLVLRHVLRPARATLAIGLLLISPIYADLAPTFMTDVPAFAFEAVCLAFGAAALRSDRTRRVLWCTAAACVIGVAGATIREYALVAPLSVALVIAARGWGRAKRGELVGGAVALGATLVVFAALFRWRRTVPGGLDLAPTIGAASELGQLVGRSVLFTTVTLGFLVLPALLFVPVRDAVRAIVTRPIALAAAAVWWIIGVAGVLTQWTWSPPILTSYLDQAGWSGTEIISGDRGLLLPAWLFQVLLVLAIAACPVLVAIVASVTASAVRGVRGRRRLARLDVRVLLAVFVVASLVVPMAIGSAGLPIFDRYLLTVVPALAGLVLTYTGSPASAGVVAEPPSPHPSRGVNAARVVGVAAFAALCLLWTTDAAAFDRARWDLGLDVTALGVPADRVDAGFEWRNVHRAPDAPVTPPAEHDPDACVVVVADPRAPAGGTELARRSYRRLNGTEVVLVARTTSREGCWRG